MKINIIGVSGSGKTTLSKEISQRFGMDIYSLDYILYKIVVEGRKHKRVEPPSDEYKREVRSILKKKKWIIEGKYNVDEVMKEADVIIVFKRNPLLSLYRQWKRYFQDEAQRRQHGFKNNILLSVSILKQFYGKEDLSRKGDWKYFRLRKTLRMINKYQQKVVFIKSQKDSENFLNKLGNIK